MLIIGGSGSGKTNSLFNLINHQQDIDKINLYAKDQYEAKYQFLINKRESIGTAQKTIFPKSWKIMECSKRPSKCHFVHQRFGSKKTVFPIAENFKTGTFQ